MCADVRVSQAGAQQQRRGLNRPGGSNHPARADLNRASAAVGMGDAQPRAAYSAPAVQNLVGLRADQNPRAVCLGIAQVSVERALLGPMATAEIAETALHAVFDIARNHRQIIAQGVAAIFQRAVLRVGAALVTVYM